MQKFVSADIDFRQFQKTDLIEIGYVSQATQEMGVLGLMNLLEDAVHYNKVKQITGVLFYDQGCFAQILEGTAGELEDLWHKVFKDFRHKNIRVLEINRLTQRNFPNWGMNFYAGDQFEKLLPSLKAQLPKRNSQPNELLKFMRSASQMKLAGNFVTS